MAKVLFWVGWDPGRKTIKSRPQRLCMLTRSAGNSRFIPTSVPDLCRLRVVGVVCNRLLALFVSGTQTSLCTTAQGGELSSTRRARTLKRCRNSEYQVDTLLHGQVEEVLPVVEEGEEVEEEGEGEGCHSSTLPFATTSTLLSQLASGTGGLRCPVSLH